MKTLILFLICLCLSHSHIYSSDSKITYDYDGNPQIYHIYFALETGLGADDILFIDWPLKIHASTDKTAVKVVLISFSNNLQIVQTTFLDYPVSSTTMQYYVTFGVALTANKWYEVQIYPNELPNPANLPFHGLVQVSAISSIQTNHIIYDSNMAFDYISIEDVLQATGSLAVAASSTSLQENRTSSIYTILIDITPTLTNTDGGNFTLYIYYHSSDSAHNSGTTTEDFSFMGLCQSVTPASGTAAILNSCEISDDLTKIQFSVNQLTSTQPIRISTQIANPLYVSTRGIRAYYVDYISGVVQENGYDPDALLVSPITIDDPGADRVYLLWGIESDYTDDDISSLSLGLYKATGTSLGPFNSFNNGFQFSQTSPIDGRYRVSMYLGATGFLQGSIAHNLPAYSGQSVYCQYDTLNKKIVCKNVGAFINTGYRYFISGKAYFDGSTASTINGFGDVEIDPIVQDDTGAEISVSLYTALSSGDTTTVHDSQEFLDTSGYHSTSTYKIGMSQVVSYEDDKTLSSTANAMKGFLTGSNSTIGIVPDLGVSQQLLFLLKVNSLSGAGSGNQMHTRLLYNNKVIGFESGAEEKGLDFAGYESGSGNWSIEYSPCFREDYVVCEKYNNDTPTANTQVRVNTTTNFYGLYKFECGDAYMSSAPCFSGDCPSACNLFTGYGTSDFNSAIMSMRQVSFDSTSFHSSLYADDSLTDFVIVFLRGSTIVSSALINAYTMVGAKMQNIKASYVNYYDSTSSINTGIRIPTMIRIAGGVLPDESRNATVIGVFFDDNIDAQTFYNTKDEAYDVGCSTGNCKYYPNSGINLHLNDIWQTMRRVEFYDIPPIQNQFNILVPVTPSASRNSGSPLPDTLTIAFFDQTHSIGDSTGLLKTLSVFRLYGTSVTESISGSISYINSMTTSSNTINSYFTSSSYSFSSTFNYALNTSNIVDSPPNNTFNFGYYGTITYGSMFGAGVTLTSFYYNIFQSSTVAFETPPQNTAQTCTIFGYVYNEQTSGNNPQRDGQWIYTAFCPIDDTMSLNSAPGNIQFNNPQYPNVFTKGFALRGVITYAYSKPNGMLVAYKHETGSASTFIRDCTTAKLQSYNPSSDGKQRATFTVSTPQIRMSASGYDGYTQFKVYVDLPSISNIVMKSDCLISEADLTCTASGNSGSATVLVNYIGTDVLTVTYFEIELYAISSGAFGTTGDYTLTIYLPQYLSSTYVPFGTSYASQTQYCECTSTFKVGNTAYGDAMNFQAPTTLSLQMDVKSPININFGSYSFRQVFYDTSYYQFNLGFLTTPANTAKSQSNFRCSIFENDDDVLTLSDKWSQLDLSSLTSVKLYPKAQIDDPASTLFTMQCYGSGVPTGGDTNEMELYWKDYSYSTTYTIQTATQVSLPTTYIPAASGTVNAALPTKRFDSQGMKAFYTFSLSASSELDVNSRIYFDFHFNVGGKLDKQGSVECYTRLNSVMDDSESVFSYCQFTSDQRLVLWNNRDIGISTTFYIDIYNIQQPKSTDTTPNGITITVDKDSDYEGGVLGADFLTDTASSSNTIVDMIIQSTSISTTFIRSDQNIEIKFDTVTTNIINTGQELYILFPPAYGQWINRGQQLNMTADECVLEADDNLGTNVVSACLFISKRVLKMTISATTSHNAHTLTLSNLKSPSKLPQGRNNQYRFKLFKADSSEEDITHYTFTDHSKHLTLEPDSNLIDLSWKYYDIEAVDSLISLTDISDQTFLVYMGYYSSVIELRQSIYPSNFQIQLLLQLTSHLQTQFLTKDGLAVPLGSTNGYFRFAANASSTNAGLYTLQFSKSGDDDSQYTQLPPLTIVVSNKNCQLVTQANSYSIPLNGMSLPINIKGIKCIPITGITIDVTSSDSQIQMNTDLSSNTLTPASNDGQLYIVLSHIGGGSLAIGDTVTITFSNSGDDASSFAIIPQISLTIVDPSTYGISPVALALSDPTLSYNQATFTLQCTMASTIYWSLGIYPSILNTEALDIQARIIAEGGGLKTNYTQPDDFFMKVYGLNYVATTQTLTKTLFNLKSNTNYIFKYFCLNQLGQASDGQSISFLSLNYGAYLMKVSITFKGSINYGQYHDLACSLAQNFQIPYDRIITEAMHYCGQKDSIFYHNDSSTISNEPNSDGQYVYNFYIVPDYSIPIDSTNSDIRTALALSSTSTTIITSTDDFIDLPELIQMQTEDIQVFTTPTMTLSDPISGLNSVVVTGSITNMNGFIVVGCMNGIYDEATMTLPTTSNIKKGLFDTNINLKQVKMLYSTQNYNVTLEFTGLPDNKEFTFFYFSTSEDPTVTAQVTTVNHFNAKTLQALTININWSPQVVLSFLGVILIMLLI